MRWGACSTGPARGRGAADGRRLVRDAVSPRAVSCMGKRLAPTPHARPTWPPTSATSGCRTEQIAALQWQRLTALLQHCDREVPYYQRRWRELGITPAGHPQPRRLRPLAPADQGRHPRRTSTNSRPTSWRDRLLYKATGGSTGEPMRFGYTRESNDRRTAVMWRGYGWAGSRMGRRTLYLWGGAVGSARPCPPAEGPPVQRRVRPQRAGQLPHDRSQHGRATPTPSTATGPRSSSAYVGPLVRLAQWLLATGRRVSARTAIIGAAEALHDVPARDHRAGIRLPGVQHLRLPRVHADRLRMRTAPGPARERRSSGGRVARPRRRRRTRRSGEVVITDLFNYGMPFVRYVNGDVATAATHVMRLRPRPAAAGRVDGRMLDAHPHAGRPCACRANSSRTC